MPPWPNGRSSAGLPSGCARRPWASLFPGLLCWLLLACSQDKPDAPAPNGSGQQPLAGGALIYQIGQTRMTVDDLRAHVAMLDPFQRVRLGSRKYRRQYINDQIEFELLAHAALARGHDRSPGAQRAQKDVMVQRLREALYGQHGARMQDVGETEVEAYLQEHPEERPLSKPGEAPREFALRVGKGKRRVRDKLVTQRRTAVLERFEAELREQSKVRFHLDALELIRVKAPN